MVLIFLVAKVFQKGTMPGYNVQKSLCLTLTWDAMSRNDQQQGYVVQHPLPQEKLPSAAQLKSIFSHSC